MEEQAHFTSSLHDLAPRDTHAEIEALRREVERLRVLASTDRGLLKTILEHSPHGIIVCDASGRLVLHNRAAERIWAGSASASSVDGWRQYRAFHPDGRPFEPGDWAMAQSLVSRRPIDAAEVRIQRFDDSFGYVLGSSAPFFDENGVLEGALSVFVDVTRWKESERAAQQLKVELEGKIHALEAFSRRASLLQKITAALARAATVQEIGDVVTAHASELFGSTSALVFLYDERRECLELASMAGATAERAQPYQRLTLDVDVPLTHAVRRGEGIWLRSHDEVLAAFPAAARMPRGDTRLEAVVALPLRTTTAVVGGIAFSFYHPTSFDPVTRDFFLTVCTQCGLAIERAFSFEAERRAREALQAQQKRLAVLVQATERLASSLESRHALAELARLVVPRIADWCGIDELAPDGSIRRLAVEHRDPAKVALAHELALKYPPNPSAEHGVARVLRTGERDWVPDIPDELLVATTVDEEHLALARSLGLTSYAAVPLVARGRVLGALSLVSEGARRFGPEDLAFAEDLGRRAALALDNARLYEAAEAARAELHAEVIAQVHARRQVEALAESLATTNRELDQFAYITSHDLKAPLRAIGSLAEWVEEDLGPAMTEDARKKMGLLRGRVRRMEALIQGILDFSRAGRLPTSGERVDVGKVVAEIVEMLGPRPPAAILLGAGLPTLVTERIALEQVFTNLIGNALKHAGRPDARVHVEARAVGDGWEFCVSDNGPGIAPAFHERIWGIFQTLAARDKVESTGIGLAIVKKIVEGRGGRVRIESSEGEGARFFFTWPKREGTPRS